MAKKYSSVRPKIKSPFAQEQQKSTAASNPHIYRGLCLPFSWQVFSQQPIKSVRQVVRAGIDCWLLTQTTNSKLLRERGHHDPNHCYTTKQRAIG